MTAINFYVIDSSSLIELNRRYPIDVFPTLWKNVEKLIEKGYLIFHKEVRKEILVFLGKDDSLKKWVEKQKKFFKELDGNQMKIVREILQKYPSMAKSDNETPTADPFIIALAVEIGSSPQRTLAQTIKGKIIVTEERLRGDRIRIPFVCKDYNIECINIIEMCRVEGWKF